MRFINRYPPEIDAEAVKRIHRETGCSKIMSALLYKRGITSAESYRNFVRSELFTEDDPYMLPNMHTAVVAIRKAIDENKSICIFGDYDADGVCATTILYKTICRFTKNVTWYIPSRQAEGYGMRSSSVKKLSENGVEFIITVDNGIAAVEEAALAYSLGMKLVITDHHRHSGNLPKAEAIVATSIDEYNSLVNDLSGAGVAWMLSRALTGNSLKEFLPFVALSIAADSVKVTKYNRDYLKAAFPLFAEEEHFKILLSFASAGKKEVSMYTLNYVFAPRINAAGRMAHADIALRFFLSDDDIEMRDLANKLEMLNQQRKSEESRIYAECIEQKKADSDVLVFYGEDWNTGVVGIVASRLTETYHKNVFVLGKAPSGEYVGSGRSDSLTDLYSLLLPCAPILNRFGGHAGAAGLSVSPANKVLFVSEINKSFQSMFPDGAVPLKIEYDMEICAEECTVDLAKEILSLAPFGPENPEPVFRICNAKAYNIMKIGKNLEHISATLKSSEYSKGLRVVGFGYGNVYSIWNNSFALDVLLTLNHNLFRQTESCEGRIVSFNSDLMNSEPSCFIDFVNAFFDKLQYNDKCCDSFGEKICSFLEYPAVTENRLRKLYLLLYHRYCAEGKCSDEKTMGTAEEIAAILIFKEMGLVSTEKEKIIFLPQSEKKDCHDSILFKLLSQHTSGGNCNGTR